MMDTTKYSYSAMMGNSTVGGPLECTTENGMGSSSQRGSITSSAAATADGIGSVDAVKGTNNDNNDKP